MSALFLVMGVVLAGMILASTFKLDSPRLRMVGLVVSLVVLLSFFTLASFRYVGEDKIGIVTKNIGFSSLPAGKIIATAGEKGPQARIFPRAGTPGTGRSFMTLNLAMSSRFQQAVSAFLMHPTEGRCREIPHTRPNGKKKTKV